ncbi:MAG: glycoside hydrolase family protein [Chloroflexi bacterium]|nr:MAG: glycoside hydrolase family protein [Chloroflexota bacterium]
MANNIHLIFKTHLDVGFTDYASVVVDNYFKKYIPASLRVARQMRDSGRPERFIWTTGSWLIYEYLEQASPNERAAMEAAIELGEIAWHALPFTTHTELMDPELYRFGLSLSQSLDKRFGKKTVAAKLTDVPGHTRGIVPLLAEAGVTFLHIGVNPGSTVPKVPRLFRWKDESGAELVVMYESGYGSAFMIDGMEDSLAFGHTSDNHGPQSPEQVLDVYREKRAIFPGANVFASTLDQFAKKLEKIRNLLPVVEQEIGDTWIHGIGSDPIKVSRYRELLRLRMEWLQNKKATYSDQRFFNFNRRLLLVPEHTWGMDEKTYLGDHDNYDADKFKASRGQANFKKFESSWVEKRNYIQSAVNALEDSPLAQEARDRLEAIRPCMPVLEGWKKLSPEHYTLSTPKFEVGFNPSDGSILSLIDRSNKNQWSGEKHPLGVMNYQTFSANDYDRFFYQYIIPEMHTSSWAREDFTKPGLELGNPVSRSWDATAKECYTRQTDVSSEVLFSLTFENECVASYGAPNNVYLTYQFPVGKSSIYIDLQWFNKPACRMPEALWFAFIPYVPRAADWKIEKLGRTISPLAVVENGNRHLHAAGQFVEFNHENLKFKVTPLDSPLVAPGIPSMLDFNNNLPDLEKGLHFCLLNNLWGTNFPMWFEEDCRFRFAIDF